MSGLGSLLGGQGLASQQAQGSDMFRGLTASPEYARQQALMNHYHSTQVERMFIEGPVSFAPPRKKAKMPIIMELQHEADEYLKDAFEI